jgi:CubicO group peptidase (beta-lactamase class C family)
VIRGEVAAGLEPVAEAFARCFEDLGETGAGLCAYVGGTSVVDLWGGSWRRDTLVNTFSVSKPLAASCLLLLWERGMVELDERIATYWPEFAQHGKERVTVRHVLAHQAGLVALREPQPTEILFDWQRTTSALAAEPPWWEPGTAHGEHAYFQGHLVGELVRRIDGRSLGSFLREEIAEPHELDFRVGVARDELERVAPVEDPDGRWQAELLDEPRELYRLALDNPPGLFRPEVLNSEAWRTAEIPAVNGHGTARAVARFYGCLLEILGAETVAEALSVQAEGRDLLLDDDRRWGLGFGLFDGGDVGLGGIGGSVGFGNLERQLGFAYLTSRMGSHDRAESVEQALLAALG